MFKASMQAIEDLSLSSSKKYLKLFLHLDKKDIFI